MNWSNNNTGNYSYVLCSCAIDEPPKINSHPESLEEVSPGKAVAFTVQATGTEPLKYLWHWKPIEAGDGSKEWQALDVEGSDSPGTLTIPNVQKSNEGHYRCVISNYAGSKTSELAKLEVS